MGKEIWSAHWFKKQNIHRPSVQDCVNELQTLQTDLHRASAQSGYEYGSVLKFIQGYLPEYDALCNMQGTQNPLPQYTDQLLQKKIQLVTGLIDRLMMVEIQPPIYQILPYDSLNIASPAQAFHFLLLGTIRKNMISLLRLRSPPSKQQNS